MLIPTQALVEARSDHQVSRQECPQVVTPDCLPRDVAGMQEELDRLMGLLVKKQMEHANAEFETMEAENELRKQQDIKGKLLSKIDGADHRTNCRSAGFAATAAASAATDQAGSVEPSPGLLSRLRGRAYVANPAISAHATPSHVHDTSKSFSFLASARGIFGR